MYWPIFIKTNVIDIVYFDDGRKSRKDTVQVQKRKLLLKHGNCCKRWIKKCQGFSTICHFYFHRYCALRAQITVKLRLTDRQFHLKEIYPEITYFIGV